MDRDEHIARHKELHRYLDELLADYISNCETFKSLKDVSIHDLIHWSHEQTINPTDLKD